MFSWQLYIEQVMIKVPMQAFPFTSPHTNMLHLSISKYADGSSLLHQHPAQEPLQPPSHTPSESPSLSPQPRQPPLASTMAAGPGAPLSAAITSASQPLPHNKPMEGLLAASQQPMQEQRPEPAPLSGGALAAAAGLQATGQILSALQQENRGFLN